MLRGRLKQAGTGAVRGLPVAAAVTDHKIASGRNRNRTEDEQQKDEHGFLHEAEGQVAADAVSVM
jgi:hypothetical protein